MPDADDIGLIKVLGFIAWSDDRIAPEERAMLDTVMNALGIPEERRRELCRALKERSLSLDEIGAAFTDDVERRFAIAQAILMARADGHLDDAERKDIAAVAGALGIDERELGMIYAAVDVTDDVLGNDPRAAADDEPCG